MKQQLGPNTQQLQEGRTRSGDHQGCPLPTTGPSAASCALQRDPGLCHPTKGLWSLLFSPPGSEAWKQVRLTAQDLLLFCLGLPSFEPD